QKMLAAQKLLSAMPARLRAQHTKSSVAPVGRIADTPNRLIRLPVTKFGGVHAEDMPLNHERGVGEAEAAIDHRDRRRGHHHGWDFLFIGGTTLLTRTYRPEERATVHALNDFLIFGTSTVSSFSSGALLAGSGWTTVQFTAMPFVAVAVAAIL